MSASAQEGLLTPRDLSALCDAERELLEVASGLPDESRVSLMLGNVADEFRGVVDRRDGLDEE